MKGLIMSNLFDEINLDSVEYVTQKKYHTDRAIIRYRKSTGDLVFNPKMVSLLDMAEWKNVVVGFDKNTKIIALKRVDAEECGNVAVRIPPKTVSLHEERRHKMRMIHIRHLVINKGLDLDKKIFRAKSNGLMILLKAFSPQELLDEMKK